MRKLCVVVMVLGLLVLAQPLSAWWDGGHMVVAYIAYQNLTPTTKARVDALLKLNPNYAQWTAGASPGQEGLVAFVRMATWPDCIKGSKCPGYTSDGGDTPPGNPTDAQNIGYADKLEHRYWHFIDVPYPEGASGVPPKLPNALTEITLLTQAIGTNETDDIKSYDLVWLEHLVGDVHQPLHCTSRFTKNHPDGDAGGNDVTFCQKPCSSTDELHAYWDGLLGDEPSVAAVTKKGKALLKDAKPAGADDSDPQTWVNGSFALAQSAAYAAPIGADNDPAVTISPKPDAAYKKHAVAVANSQVTLAGYRLAQLLNNNLQ
jgi:hypothetical protein